jgi:hypothetical protein
MTPAYLPWPVIVIENKNPQTHPRSIKCQQWHSGQAAADRDRARGLNLLTADSTTNSVIYLATDDSKPLISMSYCRTELSHTVENGSIYKFYIDLEKLIFFRDKAIFSKSFQHVPTVLSHCNFLVRQSLI